MRILSFLLALCVFSFGASLDAYAGKKIQGLGWSSSHWKGQDFKPYLGNEKIGQRSLWDDDTWTPEAWIKDAGDEKRIMRDFYATGIIIEQYEDRDNIPVLEVGDKFIQLSGVDQRRILKFIDYIFEITSSEENGMFYIYYTKNSKEPLGIYNKYGFQAY